MIHLKKGFSNIILPCSDKLMSYMVSARVVPERVLRPCPIILQIYFIQKEGRRTRYEDGLY